MTIAREGDVILLQGPCSVEDAEVLLQHVQAGASLVDWGGCSSLHTACLQVLLASRLPLRGEPAAALGRWIAPLMAASPENHQGI